MRPLLTYPAVKDVSHSQRSEQQRIPTHFRAHALWDVHPTKVRAAILAITFVFTPTVSIESSAVSFSIKVLFSADKASTVSKALAEGPWNKYWFYCGKVTYLKTSTALSLDNTIHGKKEYLVKPSSVLESTSEKVLTEKLFLDCVDRFLLDPFCV
jgi:hypothetical protein